MYLVTGYELFILLKGHCANLSTTSHDTSGQTVRHALFLSESLMHPVFFHRDMSLIYYVQVLLRNFTLNTQGNNYMKHLNDKPRRTMHTRWKDGRCRLKMSPAYK